MQKGCETRPEQQMWYYVEHNMLQFLEQVHGHGKSNQPEPRAKTPFNFGKGYSKGQDDKMS